MNAGSKNEVKILAKIQEYFWYIVLALMIGTICTLYLSVMQKEKERQLLENKFKESEKQCIVTALYHEARGEGEFGMKAIANVIHNRYKHPNYPDTYCEVINQKRQFSYTLERKAEGEELKQLHRDRLAYKTAEEIAEDMLDGKLQKFLPENTLHYAKASVKNYWTKTKKVIADIGNHRFYAEKAEKEKK